MTPDLVTRRRTVALLAAAVATAVLPACQTTVSKKPTVKPRVVDDAAALAARKRQVQQDAGSGY